MQQRRPDMNINQGFLNQLAGLEQRLKRYGDGPQTTHWNEVCSETDTADEELMLRNTFVNA